MDERMKQDLRAQLDQERLSLADPLPGVWNRLAAPRRTFPWQAVAAMVLVVGLASTLLTPGSTAADWAPVIDDLWQASETPVPGESWEIEGQTWNLLDLGGDQGA